MRIEKIALVFIFLLMICGSGYAAVPRHYCHGFAYFGVLEHSLTEDGNLTLNLYNGPYVINVTDLRAKLSNETEWLDGEKTVLVSNLGPNEEFSISIRNPRFSDMENNHSIDVLITIDSIEVEGWDDVATCVRWKKERGLDEQINELVYLTLKPIILLTIYLSYIVIAYGFDKKKYRENFKKIIVLFPVLLILVPVWFIVNFLTLPFLKGVFVPSLIITSYLISYVIMKFLTNLKRPATGKVIAVTLIWLLVVSYFSLIRLNPG